MENYSVKISIFRDDGKTQPLSVIFLHEFIIDIPKKVDSIITEHYSTCIGYEIRSIVKFVGEIYNKELIT
jgi:hypothetical protein